MQQNDPATRPIRQRNARRRSPRMPPLQKTDQLLYQQQLGHPERRGALRLKELDAQLKNQMTLNNQQEPVHRRTIGAGPSAATDDAGQRLHNQSKLNTNQQQRRSCSSSGISCSTSRRTGTTRITRVQAGAAGAAADRGE